MGWTKEASPLIIIFYTFNLNRLFIFHPQASNSFWWTWLPKCRCCLPCMRGNSKIMKTILIDTDYIISGICCHHLLQTVTQHEVLSISTKTNCILSGFFGVAVGLASKWPTVCVPNGLLLYCQKRQQYRKLCLPYKVNCIIISHFPTEIENG